MNLSLPQSPKNIRIERLSKRSRTWWAKAVARVRKTQPQQQPPRADYASLALASTVNEQVAHNALVAQRTADDVSKNGLARGPPGLGTPNGKGKGKGSQPATKGKEKGNSKCKGKC